MIISKLKFLMVYNLIIIHQIVLTMQDWSRDIMWLTVPQRKVTHVKHCKSLFFILYFMLGEIFPVVTEEGKYFLLIETYGELWNAINNELLVDILSYTLQKYLKDDNHKNFHLVQKHTCIITCPWTLSVSWSSMFTSWNMYMSIDKYGSIFACQMKA